jgi:hypothetical protein
MDKKMIDRELDRLLAEVGDDDDDLEREGDPADRVGVTIPVTDPSTERIRAPMSMPYDAGDARSAASPDHKAQALTAYVLKGAAEMGATVDEVKEAFPELAPAIDEAVAIAKQRQD